MRITTLIDNLVYNGNLSAEHGLSFLIENDNEKILFDTGQSNTFIKNAGILGIDLTNLSSVVISHGHYDHIGGLFELIKHNKKVKIYIKKEAFNNKYKFKKDKIKETKLKEFIGIPFNRSLIEDNIVYTRNTTSISENISIISEIKIYDEIDTHFEDMFIEENGKFKQDQFYDKQFLIIKNNDRIIIISGCSHRGISNIVRNALDKFNLPIDYLIGGFHFINEDKVKVENIIKQLNNYNINNIGISHCSGFECLSIFKNLNNANIFYNYTGNVINI